MLFTGKFSKEDLKKNKKRFYLIGGLMLFLGFISLSMPMLASFAVETIVGMLLIAVAFAQGWSSFRGFRDGGRPWQETIMAVAAMAAGFIFLIHPVAGVMTLSIILAAYFMADGVTKVVEYFRIREINGSVWILVSGLLGVILSVMMWKNLFTGAAVIGIILGINLVFSGISLIILGRGCSKASGDC
ncbi:MAG: HdeD family acid-resistance protein [Synergistaceae bacterium]|nr:HdeD family acid-resistance protein [Synergistaceae bacterium]